VPQARDRKDITKKLSEWKQLAPDDLAKLSKVKAKLELIGDCADTEKGQGFAQGAFQEIISAFSSLE
jgi:hypothetical protein